jgi:hypothetical protein
VDFACVRDGEVQLSVTVEVCDYDGRRSGACGELTDICKSARTLSSDYGCEPSVLLVRGVR